MKRKKINNAGFTIIEVLIVLAVVGLILVMVFKAVGALERNGRNTARKHDASMITSAREEYDMALPTSLIAGSTTCSTGGGGSGTGFGNICDEIVGTLAYYSGANVSIINNGYTPPATLPVPTVEQVISETYLICDGQNPTTTGAQPRSTVVVYSIETGSGSAEPLCIDAAVFSSN